MATNFPTSLDSYATLIDNVDDVMAVDINDPRDAIEALEAKLGINSSGDTSSIDYKVNNFFVTGRTLPLYENTAPTGWTIQNTLDDKLLFVTKGSVAGGQTGGAVHSTGTWTQPNHTHTTGGVTLTAAQSGLRAHTHDITTYSAGGAGTTIAGGTTVAQSGAVTGAVTGGAQNASEAHNHGATAGSATAATYRPAAYSVILVRKD